MGETEKTFLGINIPNWVAIFAVTLTLFGMLIGASAKVSTIEEKTNQNTKDIKECKLQIKESFSDISDIKGDIKEINGKLDILIQRTR